VAKYDHSCSYITISAQILGGLTVLTVLGVSGRCNYDRTVTLVMTVNYCAFLGFRVITNA
jgi:hypothetical protein